MIKFDLPDDKALAKKVIDAQTEHATAMQEMGIVGTYLGARDNAAIYLAWAVVVVAIIGCGALAIAEPDLRSDMGKALAALATLALGYMFGAGNRRKSKD